MRTSWYQKALLRQAKEVLTSALPYTVFVLTLLLWRFAAGVRFEWVHIDPLSAPDFFYRSFYSAFTFATLGFVLHEARFYKVLHDVIVKGLGLWGLYDLIKAAVWLLLMYLSYQYVVPALFAVLNTSASILYNAAALVLYALPSVGITAVLVIVYVLVRSSKRGGMEKR